MLLVTASLNFLVVDLLTLTIYVQFCTSSIFFFQNNNALISFSEEFEISRQNCYCVLLGTRAMFSVLFFFTGWRVFYRKESLKDETLKLKV